MTRYILFFLTVFFAQSSFAYTWTFANWTGSSPSALCTAHAASTTNPNPTFLKYSTASAVRFSSTNWRCNVSFVRIDGTGGQQTTEHHITRSGTSCPAGKGFNDTNGTCDCPIGQIDQGGQCVEDNPCALKVGQSILFTKSGSSGDGYGSITGGFVTSSQSACFGGCAVSTADQKCTGRVSGLYTCRGTAYYTGQTCATSGISTPIQENTSQQPLPTPLTINDEKPCVYSQDGTKQVCQSSKTNEKEGQFCGTVNGVKKCVDSKPTKNGITIDTTVDIVTNSDGSKSITKTDTATKTVCTGANQCTSTSTTTTTNTNTNANGDTTGVTGSCTGDACPDENTNPDGDGDGFGDCTGDDCGGGEGGSLNIGELPEFGDGTPTYGETMSAFVDKVQTIGFIAAARNISIPNGGGSCSVQPINIFGSSVSVDSFCETVPLILQPLSYLFLALWGWIAIRIILSA